MKILAAVVTFFVLVFVGIQFYPLQDSSQVIPEDQSQVVPAVNQQVQKNQNGETLPAPRTQQARQTSMSQNRVARYGPPSTQGRTQVVRKYEKTPRPGDIGYPSSGTTYKQAQQNRIRSYTSNRHDLSTRPDYVGNQHPQDPGNRQQGSAYAGGSVNSTGRYNEYVGNQRIQDVNQGRQTTSTSPGSVAYNGSSNAQVNYQGYQNTTPGKQTSGAVTSQRYSSQVVNKESTYRKDGEPVNCTYKDNRVYCR